MQAAVLADEPYRMSSDCVSRSEANDTNNVNVALDVHFFYSDRMASALLIFSYEFIV